MFVLYTLTQQANEGDDDALYLRSILTIVGSEY
jgi:hypothetical protein